jgi:DNA polymerase III subunit delta
MIVKSYLIEDNIKDLSKNRTLFYGENNGLKQDIKTKIVSNNQTAEKINFTQEEILKNKEIFNNEVFNNSLFSKDKIIFINNCTDKILTIIEGINHEIDNIKIFLFSEILEKRSTLRNYFEKSKNAITVPCYNDNDITLKKIILTKLKGYQGLNAENINLIINNCNKERDKLNNELNKITSYFTNKNLKFSQLEKLLDINTNDNLNFLKDEAFNGDKYKTNKLLSDTVIETEKNILFLSMINLRLNKLKEILELNKTKKLEDSINLIKPPVFWKDKPSLTLQASKWNLKKINNCLNETYKLEIQIKSNNDIDKNLLMKKLVVDICRLSNS